MKSSFLSSKFCTDNTANFVTTLRLISSVWFTIEICFQVFITVPILWLFNFSAVCDFIDGLIARKMNIESKFGELYDRLVDKTLVCPTFVALFKYRFPIKGNPELKLFTLALIMILICIGIILFGIGIFAAFKGWILKSNQFGKIKMILECVVIGIWVYSLYFFEGKYFIYFAYLISILLIPTIFFAIFSLKTYYNKCKTN